MPNILIIEDDTNIARLIEEQLQFEGHDTAHVTSGAGALAALDEAAYDLLVLDIGLPDVNGFEICEQVRAQGVLAPIFILTARHQTIDKVRALDIGADDYLTKPFELQEFVARVRALLRRTVRPGADEPECLRIGNLEIDIAGRTVKKEGREIALTRKEFDVLTMLVETAGKVVSRDEILDRLWPDVHVTPRSIDVHVSALRKKLEDNAGGPEIIQSVRGVGYKLQRGS